MNFLHSFATPSWVQIITALLLLAIIITPFTLSRYTKYGAMYIQKPRFLIWLYWEKSPRLAIDRYVAQGYRRAIKELGRPFMIKMCGAETTVVSPRYLPYLKVEDREELSLCANFENMFNMSVTSGKEGRHDHVEIDVVARYLNPRLSIFFPHIVSQADFAINYLFPQDMASKEFNTFEFASSLVYRLSARYMVGLELSRNHDYIDSVIDYSKSFLMSGFMWPVRPFGPFKNWFYWLGTWSLRRDISRAFSHILPAIDARLQRSSSDDVDKPLDLIQGLLEMEIDDLAEATPLRHAHRILHLTFAASAVSSALILHTIHQTLATPQYVDEVRAEIRKALKENDGWTEKALNSMALLESVVREMLRLYPPSVLTGQRVVMRETKFDESLTMPSMSRIAFPTLEIHLDEDNYRNPRAFDPYRFINKQIDGASKGDMSASKIDDRYLSFGYGKQACPGRFVAVRQVKLILAKLFHDYSFDWAGEPPKSLSRQCVEGQIFPDINTRIMLTRRAKV